LGVAHISRNDRIIFQAGGTGEGSIGISTGQRAFVVTGVVVVVVLQFSSVSLSLSLSLSLFCLWALKEKSEWTWMLLLRWLVGSG
jgi:hypothetical protein